MSEHEARCHAGQRYLEGGGAMGTPLRSGIEPCTCKQAMSREPVASEPLEVGELVAALRKIANRDLDEGDLPGMGEEVMLEDAIKTATDALARYKDKGGTGC